MIYVEIVDVPKSELSKLDPTLRMDMMSLPTLC